MYVREKQHKYTQSLTTLLQQISGFDKNFKKSNILQQNLNTGILRNIFNCFKPFSWFLKIFSGFLINFFFLIFFFNVFEFPTYCNIFKFSEFEYFAYVEV